MISPSGYRILRSQAVPPSLPRGRMPVLPGHSARWPPAASGCGPPGSMLKRREQAVHHASQLAARVALGRTAREGGAYRVESPDRVLRLWALLNEAGRELHAQDLADDQNWPVRQVDDLVRRAAQHEASNIAMSPGAITIRSTPCSAASVTIPWAAYPNRVSRTTPCALIPALARVSAAAATAASAWLCDSEEITAPVLPLISRFLRCRTHTSP
jgi:hypothetical protein